MSKIINFNKKAASCLKYKKFGNKKFSIFFNKILHILFLFSSTRIIYFWNFI